MSWFSTWFDSPLYHTLYQHRDEAEAEAFVDKLLAYFAPASWAKFVDTACGKGRHARHLAKRKPSCQVLGLDLAANSIDAAMIENIYPNCSFEVHDMLQPLLEKHGQFDYIFNLFTSFGYFDSDKTHDEVIRHWAAALRPDGRLVIDFINAQKAIANLVPKEQKIIDGIKFDLERSAPYDHIIKKIAVTLPDTGEILHFQERVRAFRYIDFVAMLTTARLRVEAVFGDYQLADFDAKTSPRLIIVAAPADSK
jgi:SAM-dependent methyltransferase